MPSQDLRSMSPLGEDDCIFFNHRNAKITKVGTGVQRKFKISVNNTWLLDFGGSREEARKALTIIKYYRLNYQCFVGRPDPSMEFYLDKSGEAPEGPMDGEDCIPFNPANLEVLNVQGRWKIVEGSHWILDFDQKEDEARQALSDILHYGFTHICFVGRPDPSMMYFRK